MEERRKKHYKGFTLAHYNTGKATLTIKAENLISSVSMVQLYNLQCATRAVPGLAGPPLEGSLVCSAICIVFKSRTYIIAIDTVRPEILEPKNSIGADDMHDVCGALTQSRVESGLSRDREILLSSRSERKCHEQT